MQQKELVRVRTGINAPNSDLRMIEARCFLYVTISRELDGNF